MARPVKKGLDFFPLDVTIDDNLELVEAECGLEGFAIVIKLWQKIYANGYYIEWEDENALLFSKRINSELTKVNTVINACFKRNLFNKTLYKQHKILTSKGIQVRYDRICRDAKRKDYEINPEFNLVNPELIPEKPQFTPEESTQSKVKESKVILEHFEKCWKLYPVKKGKDKITLTDKKELFKFTVEQIQLAINNYIKEYPDKKYQMHGRRFFKGEFKDYLITESQQSSKPKIVHEEVDWSQYYGTDENTTT